MLEPLPRIRVYRPMLTAALIPLLLFAQEKAPEKAPEKATISGTVVNYATGEPLDKVEIDAESSAGIASSVSDARGRFVLAGLEPGQYRLKGKRNRFLDTSYGSRRAEGNGTPLVVAAGENIKDLTFRLIPFGVIAGTVRDSDGEPLARVTVTALRVRYEEGKRRISVVENAFTDENGQYRITGLAPGKYYVRAEPTPKAPGGGFRITMAGDSGFGFFQVLGMSSPRGPRPQSLMTTLFPGVQDSAAARTVDLDAGGRVNSIDIALPRTSTVRVAGRISGRPGTAGGAIGLSSGQRGNDLLNFELSTSSDEKGDFEFMGVPPGSYVLTASFDSVQAEALVVEGRVTMQSGGQHLTGRLPVHVGSSPVEGLRIVVNSGAEIAGRVIKPPAKPPADGQEPQAGGQWNIQYVEDSGDPITSPFEGTEFQSTLPPGHYLPYVMGVPPGVYVRSMTADGRDVLAEGLTIAGPGKVNLEITLAADSGKIGGTVADKEDKPAAGAIVVLVPEARLRARSNRFQQVETDQYGHFELADIPPGEYKVFAWDDIEPGIWHDPDFLKTIEAKGERVTLGGHGQETVKVRLIQ